MGFDLRRESYAFGQDIDAMTVYLSPGNAALDKASRNVKAVYAELLVPIIKDLEMQFALRRDDYSLVGASTNPKVSFRYQPTTRQRIFGFAGLLGHQFEGPHPEPFRHHRAAECHLTAAVHHPQSR